ncbi:MAG: 2Fe-2S iron-sulfur cluster binding domain-containing protein [Gammaproteobacteria bacterium]|nr:2Fe-2S iron-sulfur cluster binding domain-containing protein [Gammaproteobacteria bacterium]
MSHNVRLAPFDIEFACGEDESILAAALREGIGLRYGCKHGACGSCKAKVVEGEVDVSDASGFALMDYERDAGMALLCSAYPLEDVVIELSDYDEAELSAARPIKEYPCRVVAVEQIATDIWRLLLVTTGLERVEYDPGQFAELCVAGSEHWRAYSMANLPNAEGRVEFLIKQVPGGQFSTALAEQVRIDDELLLRGPYGQFGVNRGHAPIVMIAGGSGMAPILALLRSLAAEGSERPVTFFYGARRHADLICAEDIEAVGKALASFAYVPALSEPDVPGDWTGESGLITEVIDRLSDNLRAAEAYLCGPPGMIDAAIEVLKAHGMFASRICYDKFVSTADQPK